MDVRSGRVEDPRSLFHSVLCLYIFLMSLLGCIRFTSQLKPAFRFAVRMVDTLLPTRYSFLNNEEVLGN